MDNIESVKFSGYKSFSNNALHEIVFNQYVTTIIGKNNCGKSSAIDVLEHILDFDKYISYKDSYKDLQVSFLLDQNHILSGFRKDLSGGEIYGNHFSYGMKFANRFLYGKLGTADIYGGGKAMKLSFSQIKPQGQILEKDQWDTVANSYKDYYKKYAFRRINAERDIVPEKEHSEDEVSFSGDGATNILRRFVNHSDYDEKIVEEKLLKELNKIMFPESYFTNNRIQEIQHGDEENVWEVFLEENGNRFALSKSGSGLKTIILMLINLYIIPELSNYKNKKIVYAFEEIENNLHPALQRRVFEYLYNFAKEHDARVFITTHSHVAINSLYDKENTALYHIEKIDGISSIKQIDNYIDKVQILNDLDVRASDLFQYNGIIWVEGPSDRIYINHWLKLFCKSDLLEGSDYQFLYYGGKLLSHYTTEEIDNLINMLVTNRNSAIIIDSDKRRPRTKINDTKKRIKGEFESHDLFCWITKGKEIENYLSADCINKKFRTAKPQVEQYELFPEYIKDQYKSFANSKVKFANEIVDYINDVNANDVLDLKKQIIILYNEIKQWNSK